MSPAAKLKVLDMFPKVRMLPMLPMVLERVHGGGLYDARIQKGCILLSFGIKSEYNPMWMGLGADFRGEAEGRVGRGAGWEGRAQVLSRVPWLRGFEGLHS